MSPRSWQNLKTITSMSFMTPVLQSIPLFLYLKQSGVTVARERNAPVLNLHRCVLFEVVPSGNITIGVLGQAPDSVVIYLSAKTSMNYCLASGVPNRGTNNPPRH